MKRIRAGVLAGLVALAAGLTACSSSAQPAAQTSSALNDQVSDSHSKYLGSELDPPHPRPAFTLTDTSGKPYDFSTETAGKPTLLFFGYTTCPDICPETMADISVSLKTLTPAEQKKVTVAFVTTDVQTDTEARIAAWLKNFSTGTDATFVGLRGTQTQIDAAQAASHIFLAEDSGKQHSTTVLLFGSDDYARDSFIFSGDQEQKQMEHDLPIVINS